MIIECRHCAAPLDIHAGSTWARCAYCGTTQRTAKAQTRFMQTPAGWQPPAQWTPPPQFRAPSVPLQYDASKTVRSVVLIIIAIFVGAILLPFVIIFIIVVVAATSSSSSSTTRSKPSKPFVREVEVSKPKRGGASLKVCKRAARCCRVVVPNQQGCDMMEQLTDASACRQALDSMRSAAEAQGKSCK